MPAKLVPLIERAEWNGGLSAVLPRILEPFKDAEVDALVLGCSHYPIIRPQIEQEMGVGVQVVDSGAAIARQVRRVLERESLLATGASPTYEFRDTAGSPTFREIIAYLDIRVGGGVAMPSPPTPSPNSGERGLFVPSPGIGRGWRVSAG